MCCQGGHYHHCCYHYTVIVIIIVITTVIIISMSTQELNHFVLMWRFWINCVFWVWALKITGVEWHNPQHRCWLSSGSSICLASNTANWSITANVHWQVSLIPVNLHIWRLFHLSPSKDEFCCGWFNCPTEDPVLKKIGLYRRNWLLLFLIVLDVSTSQQLHSLIVLDM